MKRGLKVLLSLLLCVCLLAACETDPAEYITRGDNQLAIEDYEGAIAFYLKAGEAGAEKVKQTHLTVAKQKLWNDQFAGAKEYLVTEAKGLFTEEEISAFLLEHLNQRLEEYHEKYPSKLEELEEKLLQDKRGEIDLDFKTRTKTREERDDNLRWYRTEIEDIITDATAVILAETPGFQETLNQAYYDVGQIHLRRGKLDYYQNVHWDDVLESWRKCTAGPGYEIANAVKAIENKNYLEGFDVLKNQIEDPHILSSIYEDIMENVNAKTLQDLLDLETVQRTVFSDAYAEGSLTDAYLDLRFEAGADHEEKSTVLSQGMMEELKTNCGKDPDGKVLILHKPSKSRSEISIFIGGMQYLPNNFYPENLESVEYVILLECDSKLTGSVFQGGTKEIREDTTVSIYDVKTGNAFWSKTFEGPTDFVFSYYGEMPAYHSAGAPRVSLQEAAAEIEKRMN